MKGEAERCLWIEIDFEKERNMASDMTEVDGAELAWKAIEKSVTTWSEEKYRAEAFEVLENN